MSLFDDDWDMGSDEQLLAGRPVPGREELGAVLGRLHALADEPAPAPNPALAAVLRDGLPSGGLAAPGATRTRVLRLARWGAGLGLAGKILIGAGVAAAAVAGTATLPVVPDAVQHPVRSALTDLGHVLSGSGGDHPAPAPSTDRERGDGDGTGTATHRPSAGQGVPGPSEAPDGDGSSRGPRGTGDGASPSPEPAGTSDSTGQGSGRGGPPADVPGGRPSSLPTPSGDRHGSAGSDNGASASPTPTPGPSRGRGDGG